MAGKIHRNSLKPGHKVLWYEIKEILGQGGFGITYLAYDPNLEKLVAIKEYLPIELAVREGDFSVHPVTEDRGKQYKWGLDRFIAEARTLSKFDYPNIVRVLSVTEENNTAYMVMVYEHGQSLQEKLKGKKTLEEAELLKILIPILGGLEHIHNAGFIHRDIKPDNIFIRNDGSPVLLDFGSARQALGEQTKTLTSLISPGYSPFEQYFSKGNEQGEWTDIYSLGATLYRAITGVAPQDAIDRSNAILKTSKDIIVTAVEIGKGRYSERFLIAIDHALNFKPEDRPQSIAEWSNEFEPPASEAVTIIPTNNRAEYKKQPISLKKRFAPLFLGAMFVIIIAFFIGDRFLRDQTKEKIDSEIQILVDRVNLTSQLDDERLAEGLANYRQANYKDTFEELSKYTEKGIPQADILVGYMHLEGDGVSIDKEKGLQMIQNVTGDIINAANSGAAWAKTYLAILYQKGIGLKADQKKYIELLKEAAAEGYLDAKLLLGDAYLTGDGVEKNTVMAIDLYKEIAEHGRPYGYANLGYMYETGTEVLGNIEKAFRYYKIAALQGNVNAQFRLATLYANGISVKGISVNQDRNKAVYWYKEAAEKGHPNAQLALGFVYQKWINVQIDYKEAFKWFMRAAEQGNAKANAALGVFYEIGMHVDKDLSKSFMFYQKGAMLGDYVAQKQLGYFYASGLGVNQDYKKAAEWFLKSAEQGYSEASYYLGHIYHHGYGVEKDLEKAFELYLSAAERDYTKAQERVAYAYSFGEGVDQDIEKAFEWYLKAAEAGLISAQAIVASYYLSGTKGVKQDFDQAFKWYSLAAEGGEATAQALLASMYMRGQGTSKDLITSYAWLLVTTDTNPEAAKPFIDLVTIELNAQDIKKAESLAEEIREKINANTQNKPS